MTTTQERTVVQALSAVMEDVQAISKNSRNTQQNFNFRGIDAVMNAVGPALRKHGVVVLPLGEEITSEAYETKTGTAMRNITLKVRFRIYGPDGSSIDAVTYGEAADAGDKAVTKAHSVAFRTCLLQALCIPTDEPDPDSQAHERQVQRVNEPDPNSVPVLRARIAAIAKTRGNSIADVEADFAGWSQGKKLVDADAETLLKYIDHVNAVPA